MSTKTERREIEREYSTYPLYTEEEERDLGIFDSVALRLFGDFFRRRREEYADFRLTMQQARLDVSYDVYLSRLFLWTIILSIISLTISLIMTGMAFGYVPSPMDLGIEVPDALVPTTVLEFVRDIGMVPITTTVSVASILIFAVIPTIFMYLKPWYFAGEREREINTMLPYNVTFMYALSRGGANFLSILKTASESTDVYGESAEEFKAIVRDVERFNTDLRTALENAATATPSEPFRDFIQDILSIVNTGGDIENFLYEKTQQYLIEARRDQEKFLETLSLMGEVYVTAFVAGPLFVIIIITVMALIGGSSINLMVAVVYGVLPLGSLGFMFVIDVIKSSKQAESHIDDDIELTLEKMEEYMENHHNPDERVQKLYKQKKWRQRKELAFNPLQTFKEYPVWTLSLTIPATLIYLALAYFVYGLPTDLVENSIQLTAVYFIGPVFITLLPITLFHEKRIRRKQRILKNIPPMLNKLSSANATGMSLEESFGVVAETAGGELGKELKKVQNEIRWRGDLNEALVRFANRIETPRLSRTVKLISQASLSTGNVTEVIDVAAKDVLQNHRLEEDRKNEMGMYTVIIIISFLVYLLVIVMLNEAFLERIARITSGTETSQEFSGTAGFNLSSLPVNLYNMIFYHSTIIQAFGAGLVAGQMGSDQMLNGIKYSLALIAIASVVFLLV